MKWRKGRRGERDDVREDGGGEEEGAVRKEKGERRMKWDGGEERSEGEERRGRDPFRLSLPPLFITIQSFSFILLSSFSSFEREGRKVEKDEGGRGRGEK